MTTSLFRCYAESLEGLRAERSLDLSQAAAYPHKPEAGRKNWIESLLDAIKALQEDRSDEAPTRHFSWNGIAVGVRRLKDKFSEAFGDKAA